MLRKVSNASFLAWCVAIFPHQLAFACNSSRPLHTFVSAPYRFIFEELGFHARRNTDDKRVLRCYSANHALS